MQRNCGSIQNIDEASFHSSVDMNPYDAKVSKANVLRANVSKMKQFKEDDHVGSDSRDIEKNSPKNEIYKNPGS